MVRFRHDTGMSSLSLYPSLLSLVFPASALVGHNAPVKDSNATAAEDRLNWCTGDIVAFSPNNCTRIAAPSAIFQSSRIGVKNGVLPRCGVADNKAGSPCCYFQPPRFFPVASF